MLFLVMLIMGASSALLPAAAAAGRVPLIIVSAAQGASLGAIDAGGVAFSLFLWPGKMVDALLYALQFASAMGAFVGPLAAAPFLAGTDNGTNNGSKMLVLSNVLNLTTSLQITNLS